VTMIQAAPCSELICGKFSHLRPVTLQAAQSRLCMDTECSSKDLPHCCMEDTDAEREHAEEEEERKVQEAKQGEGDADGDEGKVNQTEFNRQMINKALKRYKKIGCTPQSHSVCSGQTCWFDESCLWYPPRLGGLGCYAAGLDFRCRFCGFSIYPPCPQEPDCFSQPCSPYWDSSRIRYCFQKYNVQCPEVSDCYVGDCKEWTLNKLHNCTSLGHIHDCPSSKAMRRVDEYRPDQLVVKTMLDSTSATSALLESKPALQRVRESQAGILGFGILVCMSLLLGIAVVVRSLRRDADGIRDLHIVCPRVRPGTLVEAIDVCAADESADELVPVEEPLKKLTHHRFLKGGRPLIQ